MTSLIAALDSSRSGLSDEERPREKNELQAKYEVNNAAEKSNEKAGDDGEHTSDELEDERDEPSQDGTIVAISALLSVDDTSGRTREFGRQGAHWLGPR